MSSSNLRKDCVRYPSSMSREKSNGKRRFAGTMKFAAEDFASGYIDFCEEETPESLCA